MASINLVYRASTRHGRHRGSLSLRIIHCRQVKTITLAGCRIYPDEWDGRSRSVVCPEDTPRRSDYLEGVKSRVRQQTDVIYGFISTLERQGRYSLDDLMRLCRRKTDEGKLLGYAETLARELERRGQERTARAYRTVTRGIVRFNKGRDIPLGQLNSCLIKDFEIYLKTAGRLPNTVSYYMRNLRAIYNKAIADKRIVNRGANPFAGVYTGVTRTMKRALSLDEVKRLHELDFAALLRECGPGIRERQAAENLCRSWRYFDFCLYTRGMSFVDLAYLRKENIRGGFIRYVRKKTGQQIEVKVTSEIQDVIDSFAKETAGSPYVFPIIRNNGKPARLQYESALRSQNHRLKRLAGLAGIGKAVSTHWARHTWASVGKQRNLPVGVISECLGHTSERTTRIYLDSLENSLLDAANDTVLSAIARPQAAAVLFGSLR